MISSGVKVKVVFFWVTLLHCQYVAASDHNELQSVRDVISIANSGSSGGGGSLPHHEFGYDPDEPDELSPERWSEDFHQCTGKYQSPIDIEETLVYRVSLPELRFVGFDQEPTSTLITNNGHTVMFNPTFSEEPYITGGPLGFNYTFSQLHFHWGVNDSVGSEDLINNRSYPMELHMVFYNKDYNSSDRAQGYKDGLVVLASFFEVSEEDNRKFQSVVSYLPNVTMPNMKVTAPHVPANLNDLLPKKKNLYFTYKGSLTTPPCSEVVTWIDFKNPILLSHAQLAEFRHLHKKANKFLTHNSRPVQPLSGRPVWYNFADEYVASSSLQPGLSALLAVLSILGALQLLQ